MTILVLAIGSISGVGTSQFVMGSDGGNINGFVIACVYGACKDNTFNAGSSGGGGGSQPTPNTGKLIVTKKLVCTEDRCRATIVPGDFHITVTGDNASPSSFAGNADGTDVTLGAGNYKVDEERCPSSFTTLACVEKNGFTLFFEVTFSADCTGGANGGETKQCTVTNTEAPV